MVAIVSYLLEEGRLPLFFILKKIDSGVLLSDPQEGFNDQEVAKRRRTTKEPVLTKLDYWAIAANEVYMACRKANVHPC